MMLHGRVKQQYEWLILCSNSHRIPHRFKSSPQASMPARCLCLRMLAPISASPGQVVTHAIGARCPPLSLREDVRTMTYGRARNAANRDNSKGRGRKSFGRTGEGLLPYLRASRRPPHPALRATFSPRGEGASRTASEPHTDCWCDVRCKRRTPALAREAAAS